MKPVERLWPESTVACIASGPSLVQDDVDQALCWTDWKVMVVNDVYKIAPLADALFAADFRWWERNPDARKFEGLKFSAHRSVGEHYPEVHTLRVSDMQGFDPDPVFVRSGANSGHMAIHTAVHLGASRIVLLGYDMQPTGGRNHFHEEHEEQRPIDFGFWIQSMTILAAALRERGVEVLNATRETALTCFPRVSLEEVL